MKWLPAVLLIGFEGIFANIWPPRPPKDPPQTPPIVQSFGSAREADCTRDDSAGNIFGETAEIRGELNLPAMPPGLARAATAARIAQDADTARAILADHLGDGTAETGQLARLQLAYALLRLAPTDPAAEAAAIRELLLPEAGFSRYSDAHYIRAVLAEAEGRREEARADVTDALAINPKFYNAIMLRAILILQDADADFRSRGACQPLFDALISAAVPVARLGACPLQLAHFRLALDRALPQASGPRRLEMMRVLDIALAYAARKDSMHGNMLASYAAEQEASLCRQELERHDFGTALD